ncbi:MAG: restriction endonuclease subunit S [Nocardioidaceae bacterium]
MSSRFVGGEFVFVTREKFERDLRRNTAKPGDLMYTQRGTLGQVSLVPTSPFDEYVISQSQMRLRINTKAADPRFVYYACRTSSFRKQVDDRAIATGVPHINLGILAGLTIPDREPSEQRAIAEVLGALDDMIAANEKARQVIDQLAGAELKMASRSGVVVQRLGEIAEFLNRSRVPLSSRDREGRPGSVPYYGAAGRMDFVDSSIFDEELVLVGEDGSVVRNDGRPVVQYVWGPAWVNNHAHVLRGKGISLSLLRRLVERANVHPLVTGAVQPKLSMGNLKSAEIPVPTCSQGLSESLTQLDHILRALVEQNRALARTRDELLPLLMSGRLRVRDAEQTAGEVL